VAGWAPEAERPFSEPWQASAFALAVHLHERGLFTWPEWAEALSAELAKAGAAGDGNDGYYSCWLAALERLLVARGIANDDAITATAESWKRAAHATPHGKPILFENDPHRH
jgi:nitrile hydratase accessory protein